MKRVFYSCFFILFISCDDKPEKQPVIDIKQLQENLIVANKKALSKESEQIKAYVKAEKLDVIQTKTGLRYQIYNDEDGIEIKNKQRAVIQYTVTLLDGTVCYATKDKSEEFTVGKDYVESGLHEGVQLMSVGDKAIIIIPSHLGHGLAGDLKKIPIKSTIVYDLELLEIK